MTINYREAGVDLQAAREATRRITTRTGGGLFGGFVPVSFLRDYREPVLVSSIDGIGTKVRLASVLGHVEGLGQDIVHHCVNDIAVHGATPLLFMDYLALHRLDPELVARLVESIAQACETLGVQLAGGETAEMPLVYREGHFDIAGAVVGVVERDRIVDGSAIADGDVLLGIPSSWVHTNGYSLVQALFTDGDMTTELADLNCSLGEALLAPHRCYLEEIHALIETGAVHGLAHITGGGIAGNLSRIMPPGLQAVVRLEEPPTLFRAIQERGVTPEEMRAVFNMGVGLIAVCASDISVPNAVDAQVIGSVHRRSQSEKGVMFYDDHGFTSRT